MHYAQVIGYAAAGLGILMFAMQTMIPLRVTAIAHNLGQIAFGLLTGVYPMVIQHTILLPLNAYRLIEMLNLIKHVKFASSGHSIDWFKPFMNRRRIGSGTTLFRRGDDADHMLYLLDGRLHVEDIAVDILPGAVVGELGMLAPGRKRTQTVVCSEDAIVLEMPYSRIEQLYFQNPTFGFYFLNLSTARLFANIEQLESKLASRERELRQLQAAHGAMAPTGAV
ncbi:MAG TPA: cyclic nucleotide-binding domain-containing protein [Pseudolabrys sp.]|nr:cyclic nucleotide-binding domain-containing protein [Pseudolabrys sp.]